MTRSRQRIRGTDRSHRYSPATLALASLTLILSAAVALGGLGRSGGDQCPGKSPKAPAPADRTKLTVHEWGTFTVLQDEDGQPLGGINTDDEPVPDFVHNTSWMLTPAESEIPPIYFKAIPRCHTDVYVRLETPVVYFYPPAGFTGPVDLNVAFRGGWLTQFYPDAKPGGPGINADGQLEPGRLTDSARGSLSWTGLKFDGTAEGPNTDNKAWLAPRDVPAAASVVTEKGERERYLFYRGVGSAVAPLRVRRDGSSLYIHGQWGREVPGRPGEPGSAAEVGPLWLFDARADGSCAFRAIDPVRIAPGDPAAVAQTSAHFDPSDYSPDNLTRVREALHAGLVRDGMYADEADALLNTWEVSYFRRPGLRLFFMVPRVWTDHYLPLEVSSGTAAVPTQVERAMIGRIELVTPEHRELLRRIAAGPVSSTDWAEKAWEKLRAAPADRHSEEWYRRVSEGRSSLLEELGLAVPPDYRTYLALGRFRNALINDERRRRPTEALGEFVERYHLQPFRPGID
jgi:hypothetical protein